MKTFLIFLFLPLLIFSQKLQLSSPLRFLALGDSYTIGQSVAVNASWPMQLRDSLAKRGIVTDTLTIIATTGWRSDDLLNAISGQDLKNKNYNLVSVLIGVNNQFQGRPFSQYQTELPALLDSALMYAGGDTGRVFVVSIPDYAFTPFGQQAANPALISTAIDQYNFYNKQLADSFKIRYFDITPISRQGINNPTYVAGDGLHPSGEQYAQWVKLILAHIDNVISGLSRETNKREQKFTLSPNPANSGFTIAGNDHFTGNLLLSLFDPSGRLVLKQQSLTMPFEVSVNDLDPGIYTVRLTTTHKITVKKLVIHPR